MSHESAVKQRQQPQCCCRWGAAVGNRGNGPSGEVPEFPCADCPRPGHNLMVTDDQRCRRHRREQEVLRCPKCTGLLAEATGVCTVCGHDPLGYYCDELFDHSKCEHTR